jgi:DNA modification methylase
MALAVRSFQTDSLHPYRHNPRRGDVAAIAESLRLRGQYRPIVVNVGSLTGRPMEVLAGNHTLFAALSLGWAEIEATTVDVDEEGAAQIVAADNRLADLGGYDPEDLLATLVAAGDLAGTGYTETDLAALLRDLEEPVGLTDPDAVPDLPVLPVSASGDVWILGPHRLLVGDSGDPRVAGALMGEDRADVVWTDPPYGVNYVGGTGLEMENDDEVGAEEVFAAACRTMIAAARPGAPVYVCHSDVVRQAFIEAMAEVGIQFRQTLIWVKNSLVLSHSDYHYRHEPILEGELPGLEEPEPEEFTPVAYGFTPGGEGRLGRGGKRWFGDHRQTTVFEVPRPSRSIAHPTMKPVELVEGMLRNSCPPGGMVLDLFAGSGTTMIACHRLGLKARLVELDPRYADVICRRWQDHTGLVPVREGVEVSFDD